MSGELRDKEQFLLDNPDLLPELEGGGRPTQAGNGSECASAVGGGALIRDVESFIRRFVVLPPKAALPVALWVVGTHCFELFEAYPYLAIVSPTKRCGKTRLTEVLSLLVANPCRTINISEAALFRLTDGHKPTLILDEAEALRNNKSDRSEALRALLNAGHRRDAVVPRCVGNAHELQFFHVFCPKALCAIGDLPDTIRDRSIVLPMQRRRAEERVERFLHREVKAAADALRDRASAFTEQRRDEVSQAYSGLNVPFLEDREAEMFEPLFALLFVGDLGRLEELRLAAKRLSAAKESLDLDDSLPVKLLADTRTVFGQSASLSTAELVEALRRLEESPWAERELTPRRLARMLRGFGVEPRTIRLGNRTPRGYAREAFVPAWERYL